MNAPAELEMTVTPDIEQILKGHPFFLEIEMLKGFITKLPDGRKQFKVIIHDQDKGKIVYEFVLKIISQSLNACKN